MEDISRRLRDAHKSTGTIDALWTDAADTTVSCCGSFRFRVLRLRRELVFHDAGRSAGEPLRCGQRHETPILVVIVKPGFVLREFSIPGFTITTRIGVS